MTHFLAGFFASVPLTWLALWALWWLVKYGLFGGFAPYSVGPSVEKNRRAR